MHFNKNYGKFEYLVLSFGGFNTSAKFQTLINEIFHDCMNQLVVMDIANRLTFSSGRKSHYKHLEIVFKQLRDSHLYASPGKCKLFKEKLTFLASSLVKMASG